MNAISMTMWRRVDYARSVLDALSRNPGIGSYELFIGIDGGPQAMPTPVIDFAKAHIVRRPQHIGCNQNTLLTLREAFAHSDYVIHIEDDVLVAPDTIRYFEWARQFGDQRDLFTVTCWRHPDGWLPQKRGTPEFQSGSVRKVPHFDCWGWATWRDRFAEMEHGWTTKTDRVLSWDTRVQEIRGYRYELSPMIGRAQNIGRKNGTHRPGMLVSYWAGSPEFRAPNQFTLA